MENLQELFIEAGTLMLAGMVFVFCLFRFIDCFYQCCAS